MTVFMNKKRFKHYISNTEFRQKPCFVNWKKRIEKMLPGKCVIIPEKCVWGLCIHIGLTGKYPKSDIELDYKKQKNITRQALVRILTKYYLNGHKDITKRFYSKYPKIYKNM